MLKNYFLLSIRNLWKSRVFTLINVSGLAIGLATALLIILWVKDEYSVDKFHKNAANLYRVIETSNFSGKESTNENTQGPLWEDLKAKFPEIIRASPTGWPDMNLFKVGSITGQQNGNQVSPDFFSMFSFPFVEGDAAHALDRSNSIVITEQMRATFFGDQKALGKSILVQNKDRYTVTGVIRNIPANSTFQFDFAVSFENVKKMLPWMQSWENRGMNTFVQVKPGTSLDEINRKIRNEVSDHETQTKVSIFLQPFSDVYLYSDFSNGKKPGGRIQYVQLFSIIGVLVLLIACINFMNLSTASSSKRAKEIGVRKVVGAEKKAIVLQFLFESVVLAAIAMLLALAIVFLLLPSFNALVSKHIEFSLLNAENIGLLFFILLVTGLLAGSYPAVFLSSFKPILILKGSKGNDGKSGLFRKILVVFQFCMSIILIIGTVVVYKQVSFLKNKELGLNKSNLIELDMNSELGKNYKVFQSVLESSGTVSGVSYSANNLLELNQSVDEFEWQGKVPGQDLSFPLFTTDSHFLKTAGLRLKEGRMYKEGESGGFVLTEEAIREMKLKEPVLGQTMSGAGQKGSIIGIVKDFNITNLHSGLLPSILVYSDHPEQTNYILVRTEKGRTAEALQILKENWKRFSPSYDFSYTFFDQEYAKLYSADQLVGTLAACFSGITIFISCLGLLGLSIFTAEQRLKEVSIRKVLGAGVFSIVFLLSKNFLKLVLLANLIAWPLAFLAAGKWLANYAYRIQVSPWIYIGTAVTALFIALISMSFHSIKAANANPAKVLRND